ncbi:uncharacterized protein DUF4129 [Desulfobotulus alkaliphilus]|uniref:Uncharacterized protein DUF4129 n=1 Tax=Desulfobotulus alkaliphilus TaxID=622671 RepID=A0A562RS69_9BACT|nr:DUF3488 and transglutaminase-like domain-containing protein [Desulfobotulus alkaliphilus]TWI71146.1 uncharacterized protein DUF4129 [Desulfobotulus alkaliphilus]
MPLSLNDKNRLLPPLIFILALSAGPQFLHQPLWLTALVCLAWLMRLAMARGYLPLPGKKTILAFTWIFFFIILAQSAGTFAQDAGSRLLLIMAALKTFELKERRDAIALVFIAHLLVLSSLLFSESLAMALYMALALICNHAVLALIHHEKAPLKKMLLQAATLFFVAAPLAIILFVSFPRLSSPLWGIRTPSPSGITGFSDQLQPGSVATLAKSNEPAFRVQFEGPIPSSESRYFRGIVFRNVRSGAWLPDREVSPLPDFETPPRMWIRYSIIMEPHQHHWLFALDWPIAHGTGSVSLVQGGLARNKDKVQRRMGYTLESSKENFHLERPDDVDLYLPSDENPKALALGRKIYKENPDESQRLGALVSWIQSQPFRYTLNPGLLPSKNSMDAFLFETQQGYCEHFSMGFATLARAAGLPARIIGGYQGGEINPIGPYLMVKQSDAHAWTEIYLENQGWQRMDPTALIAPLRLDEGGMAASLSEEDRMSIGRHTDLTWLERKIRPLGLFWDSATHLWHRQVLAYTHTRQREFFARLGAWLQGAGLFYFLSISLASGLFIYGLTKYAMIRLKNGKQKDKVLLAWNLLCQKMKKAGFPRDPHEGPMDYAKRIRENRPELADALQPHLENYVRLRYGNKDADPETIQGFLKEVRRFRVPSLKKKD